MATARTITRFGRTYSEYDPDGAGGGPTTWILSAPGAGGTASGVSPTATGTFTPDDPSVLLRTGMALYIKAPGILDCALAKDPATTGVSPPYLAIGLAAADVTNGMTVGVITDGQLSMNDWSNAADSVLLVPHKRYFLSDVNPGKLTSVCPTAIGSTVICIGQAISQQTLDIEVNLMVHL